ncbi:hypothetical protein QQ045_017568 [Rhodiola kirilowii]
MPSEDIRLFSQDNAKGGLDDNGCGGSLDVYIVGDFNEVLCTNEVSRLNHRRQQAIEKFRSVVSRCGLIDIGFRGYKYTYSNKRRGEYEIKSRLDRALADRHWLNKFKRVFCATSLFLLIRSCRLVQFEVARCKEGPAAIIQIREYVADTRQIKPTVKEEWRNVEGRRQMCLAGKLQAIQRRLTRWNKDTFGIVKDRILHLKKGVTSSTN